MKKKALAIALSLCMTAGLMAGCGSKPAENTAAEPSEQAAEQQKAETEAAAPETEAAEMEKEPVELTLWVTSRNTDDFSEEIENQFLEEHPWITLNKVVKEGDPGNEFYQGVAAG